VCSSARVSQGYWRVFFHVCKQALTTLEIILLCHLAKLPDNIGKLSSLKMLWLQRIPELRELPELPSSLVELQLHLPLMDLPPSFSNLIRYRGSREWVDTACSTTTDRQYAPRVSHTVSRCWRFCHVSTLQWRESPKCMTHCALRCRLYFSLYT